MPCLVELIYLLYDKQASNSYLWCLKGAGKIVAINFVKDMPKGLSPKLLFDPSSSSPLLYTWVIQLLFPVCMTVAIFAFWFQTSYVLKEDIDLNSQNNTGYANLHGL